MFLQKHRFSRFSGETAFVPGLFFIPVIKLSFNGISSEETSRRVVSRCSGETNMHATVAAPIDPN